MFNIEVGLYSLRELKDISKNLIQELTEASSGVENSFAYANNQIPNNRIVQNGETFQVIVMGGSHLESALVKNNQGEIEILSKYSEDLPNLENKDLVCEIFARQLHSDINKVALNFAYPMQPIIRDNSVDGILIAAPKEHKFIGLLHTTIGLTLEQYVLETQKRKISVSVCNDTVSLGLAGSSYSSKYTREQIICGIVGTGFNFGFFAADDSFINIESGNFDKFEQSSTGKIIDALSTNPGKQYFEKEVGGAYLSKHFNILAKINHIETNLQTTKELSHVCESENKLEADIANNVFEKAASLVAIEIFSIYEFKKQALGEFQMLCLIEGSLFWKGYKFKEKVFEYLEELGLGKDKCEIVHIQNSGILGAASLVI